MADYYLEQLFASIITLKAKMPGAFVSLLVDKDTERSLSGERGYVRNVVDELISEEFPSEIPQKVRSRLLKTSMRNLVKGDFLYIDTDTFIFDDLSGLEESSMQFAGVQDKHCPLSENDQVYTHKQLKKIVCDNPNFINDEIFINSGVLFVRDSLETRSFFKEWNDCYLKNVKNRVTQDMPSLAWINYSHANCITKLDGAWNCQLESGAGYFRFAKIFHYFASHTKQKSLNRLLEFVRKSGFDERAKKFIVENYERIAFDFGTSMLVSGVEMEIQKTACYRFLVILYVKFRGIFNLCEKILSIGRGRGFYFGSK